MFWLSHHLALSVCDLFHMSHYNMLDTLLLLSVFLSCPLLLGYLHPFSHATLLSIEEAPRQKVLPSSRCLFQTALLYCVERTNLITGGQMACCDCSSLLAANPLHPIICYPVFATTPRPTHLFVSSTWFVLPFRSHALEQRLSFHLSIMLLWSGWHSGAIVV